jgi:hypothetical protein
MKKSVGDYYGNCETGWKRIKVNITVYHANEVSSLEAFPVKGLCLELPFILPDGIWKHASSITHVSLEFYEGDIAPSNISFLENFPNLESVWVFEANFNDEMLETIYKCLSLCSFILHSCKMGKYLSKIAKTCYIENL